MKKIFFLILCMASIFVGCNKQDIQPTEHEQTQVRTELLGGSKDNGGGEVAQGTGRSNYGQIVGQGTAGIQPLGSSGNSSSTTPTPGAWFIGTRFSNQYQHYCQLQASPQYPGGVLCGPTCYMLATHMIAAANQISYPSNKTRLGLIYDRLTQASRFDNAQGMYISDLTWYANTYDNSIISTYYKRTTSRDWMKEFIEYYIKTGYPVIVTVQVYGTKRSQWASNDADMNDQAGKTYYISKNGTVGHFILLIGIKINADGSGTVWYKDPLSPDGITQSASYTRILDAMKYNGNNDYYDAVGISE